MPQPAQPPPFNIRYQIKSLFLHFISSHKVLIAKSNTLRLLLQIQ
jgi:hypothetical protein